MNSDHDHRTNEKATDRCRTLWAMSPTRSDRVCPTCSRAGSEPLKMTSVHHELGVVGMALQAFGTGFGCLGTRPRNPGFRKKASRGFEPRSLDSESRVLTVTPRGRWQIRIRCPQKGTMRVPAPLGPTKQDTQLHDLGHSDHSPGGRQHAWYHHTLVL